MIAELFRYNTSTLFILKPVVGINFGVLKKEFGVINSYLKDKAREDLEGDMLFVLFKPVDFDYFEQFLEEQQENSANFLEDYDYAGGYVVVVYKIPEKMKEDFELFKQGKYSKLSDIIKNCYDKEVKAFLKPMPSFQHEVFSRAKRLKEELEEFLNAKFEKGAELWSLPDLSEGGKETLDIEKFLKPEINERQCVTDSSEEAE